MLCNTIKYLRNWLQFSYWLQSWPKSHYKLKWGYLKSFIMGTLTHTSRNRNISKKSPFRIVTIQGTGAKSDLHCHLCHSFQKNPLKKPASDSPSLRLCRNCTNIESFPTFFFPLKKFHFTITISGAFPTSKLSLGSVCRALLSSGAIFVSSLLSVILSRWKKPNKTQGTHQLQQVPACPTGVVPFSCWAPVTGGA